MSRRHGDRLQEEKRRKKRGKRENEEGEKEDEEGMRMGWGRKSEGGQKKVGIEVEDKEEGMRRSPHGDRLQEEKREKGRNKRRKRGKESKQWKKREKEDVNVMRKEE